MKTMACAVLMALALFPAGLRAAFAEDAASCALRPIMSTHTPMPYPPISARLHEHGETETAVTIGADGAPTDVSVTISSGSERLDAAMVNHIKTSWRWEPPARDCKSAQALVNIDWHIGFPPDAKAQLTMKPSDYPHDAAIYKQTGDTYLELTLGDGGAVRDARVVYGSGFRDLDNKAARAAVESRWAGLASQPAGTQTVLARWSLPGVETVNIYTIDFKIVE
jgi:TonB family protein